MAKAKPQLLRLVFIDERISTGMRTGRYPNCRTLAAAYEGVSAKTIQRDLDYMKWQLGAPLAYDADANGYY